MPRLEAGQSNYIELPFCEGYRPELDPFFIARANFMIGSQSGPCAYARAFGTPILTINAILHYTLLPASREMACFKRYFVRHDGERYEIGINDALNRRTYHFDNSFQFEAAAIEVESAAADEISAAIDDMIAWNRDPSRLETADQISFRKSVEHTASDLAGKGSSLDLPIGDFIGISLPGYRLAPSVAAMRAVSAEHPKPQLTPCHDALIPNEVVPS
jgi:putative glycosyltransferase (TIGR04372 family)